MEFNGIIRAIAGDCEQVFGVDYDNRTIDVVMSTDQLIEDRNVLVDQDGWDFSQWKLNPVVLWAHDDRGWTGSVGLPVGKGLVDTIRKRNLKDRKGKPMKATTVKIQFAKREESEFADTVFQLMAGGYLNAVSVGFTVKDYELGKEEAPTRFLKQKLWELSVVTIPADNNALVVRSKELNKNPEEALALAGEVQRMSKDLKDQAQPLQHVQISVGDLKGFVMVDGSTDKLVAEVEKRINYYDKKQPANLRAVKVMESFFKSIGQDQPSDEVEAWTRFGQILAEKFGGEEEGEGEKVETVTISEDEPEAPASPQAQAKPALLRIPLSRLKEVRDEITRQCVDAAVKASQRGMTEKHISALVKALGDQLSKLYAEELSQSYR